MRKRSIKSLSLNKITITKMEASSVVGGTGTGNNSADCDGGESAAMCIETITQRNQGADSLHCNAHSAVNCQDTVMDCQ